MKNSLHDTIAAIATPPGFGWIGIIRISGPRAVGIAEKVWEGSPSLSKVGSHQMIRGKIGEDDGLAVVMLAPNSYTGEDVVEFHGHGSPALLQAILENLFKLGARPAAPGEFTERAFLNGKLDLAQAEAVSDLIHSETETAARLAARQLSGALSTVVQKLRNELKVMRAQLEARIDFPEDEDVQGLLYPEIKERLLDVQKRIQLLLSSFEEGRKFREGVRVALCGRPNVGKSSLLNALLLNERAIVHHEPGTTRDTLEETINLNGIPVRLIDTAGIRRAGPVNGHPLELRSRRTVPRGRPVATRSISSVEEEGIRRSFEQIQKADLILFLVDQSEKFLDEDRSLYEQVAGKNPLVIFNKSDLPGKIDSSLQPVLKISAKKREGIEELKKIIFEKIRGSSKLSSTELLLTNVRHKNCLEQSLAVLEKVAESVQKEMSLEFLAADLLIASNHLAEITGEITHDEVLGEIFSKFCIGK
ncbi:MAG: tRNA uridine-5-carboxymethylaminomethyl(34) synthesis GTPase MnmE [bacterium]|nr:tRNA uridine-5-carboxymethylaminomethyl(34) synthesis GTPase MnmE [bacterium]